MVALSDDPQSLATLARFRSGTSRWLVVCKMAGEGYDNSGNYFLTREEQVKRHVETFIGIHVTYDRSAVGGSVAGAPGRA